MSLEKFPLHAKNQVLACLRDTRGNLCGEEVMKRVTDSEIFILIGEPAIGKSTVTDQIAHELRLIGASYEIVRYDDVLAEHIQDTGVHEEDALFNAVLFHKVLDARMRMSEVGGVVLFDTCAVGKKNPRDRSVTAVEDLVRFAQEGNPLFSKLSILALIGSFKSQFDHAQTRFTIMNTPSPLVVATLQEAHNIIIHDIPPDVPAVEVGESIKQAARRSARPEHIARIAYEVGNTIPHVPSQRLPTVYSTTAPHHFSASDRHHTQLRAAQMTLRATQLRIPDERWLTAINLPTTEPISWYAHSFLRRDLSS